MKTLRAALLLWTVAACAETDDPLEEVDETGFQKCRDALKLPVLEVLPGGGWDNLRNMDMGRVMALTYTHCRTTEDGQYIIPNEVFTVPQKQSALEMNSEILESWMDYKSSTSSSINLDISLFSKVNGKFSAEFQRLKTLQVRDQAFTTRVEVRNVIYTVKINPASELTWEFKKELLDISDVALCPNLEQKNPLTGDFSCPSGYTAVRLLSQIHEEGYNHLECKKKCTLYIFCKTVCEDVFRVARAQFRAFWCAASSQDLGNLGLLFGGLFSSRSVNPLTNQQSCPAGYTILNLFETLKVCVTQDYELGHRFSIPFGGFFSCAVGNPLINSTLSRDLQKRCPGGFSQHLALISDGCQVSYCVRAGAFTGWSLPTARLPPFTRPPLMSQAATNTVIVTNSESSSSWFRDSQTHRWRLGEPQELRRTMRNIQGENGGLSGGAAVGVSVAVTSLLAALIALAFYGIRKYRSKGHHAINREQERLLPETAPGTIPELEPEHQAA
ncbi:macrophage-expressed gene 1 protein [Octodon degus]|uniref:Macrophage-expressed gene 1 protein n=1 Tax=Octodon degus TaxID=10160 RepID=A0A6P3FH18_OCTDE|nr:macrophage-expressed gene 1 protein [Octodon degus]